ncbi:MAG: 4-alpha-glucanotransferase [Peptostreptococcus porci]|nr:4-alpha-glucanotransferase [Peptostreptococcus porci]
MRKSGILMPIFSLPSKYGIGSLGNEAYNFVDFLVRTGQSVWQILPITSTSSIDGYSPYKSNGAFSGNYDLIDIDLLVSDGYIDYNFINSINYSEFDSDPRYVDYGKVRKFKRIIFTEVFNRFDINSSESYKEFLKENKYWLDDYSSYMALREINGDNPYWDWKIKTEKEVKKSKDSNIINWYIWSLEYNKFLQYLFYDQWFRLKSYANDRGIEIFGDIPIYISQDSSDFYFNKEIFLTDQDGEPKLVSGVPPDEFSATGQYWGNPLYNWKYLEKNGFDWWINRVKKSFELYDILRIDHFRGLESYYCIDKSTKDAMNGYWEKAPGKEFFDKIKKEVPDAKIVAEDLGLITKEVIELLEYTGFPGMKIVQFGFSTDADNMNLPHNFVENTVSYTGTHDNMPLAQWLKTAPHGTLEYAKQYLRLNTYERYTEGLIRAVVGSASNMAIVPMQDWLDFDGWARINTPSTDENNWRIRLVHSDFTRELENYISYITGLYGRYKNR